MICPECKKTEGKSRLRVTHTLSLNDGSTTRRYYRCPVCSKSFITTESRPERVKKRNQEAA